MVQQLQAPAGNDTPFPEGLISHPIPEKRTWAHFVDDLDASDRILCYRIHLFQVRQRIVHVRQGSLTFLAAAITPLMAFPHR